MNEIVFSSRAHNDLAAIIEYDLEHRTPGRAARRLQQLQFDIGRLSIWLEFGHPTNKPGRRVLYSPGSECKIYYRITSPCSVVITHIRPTRMRDSNHITY